MGCIPADKAEVSTDMLKTQLKKIKYSVEICRSRLEREKIKGDQILYNEVTKSPKQRSKQLERIVIIGNVRYLNQKNIYSLIQNETNIILQHANFLEDEKQLMNLRPQLNTIRYCASFMSCDQLVNFQCMIMSRYPSFPFPSENQITNELLKYEKRQQVAFKNELQYILQFSSSYAVPMEKINEVGHHYRYGAQKYQG